MYISIIDSIEHVSLVHTRNGDRPLFRVATNDTSIAYTLLDIVATSSVISWCFAVAHVSAQYTNYGLATVQYVFSVAVRQCILG